MSRDSTPLRRTDSERGESTPRLRRDSAATAREAAFGAGAATSRDSTPKRGSTPRDSTPRRGSAPRPFREPVKSLQPLIPHLKLRPDALDDTLPIPTTINALLARANEEEIYAKYLEHSPRAPITPLSAPVHGRSASLVQMCKKCGARFRVVNFGTAYAWMCYESIDGVMCGNTWFTANSNYRACNKAGHESHPEYQWDEYGAACTPCKKFVSFADIELGLNNKKKK